MKRKEKLLVGLGIALIAVLAGASASENSNRPVFGEDGVVYVPAFELPPSEFLSEAARALQMMRARMPKRASTQEPDSVKARKGLAAMLAPQVTDMLERYSVDISEEEIAGVAARIFTPKGKTVDPDRVLINLHGGAFQTCWESCSILESAPIAALGGYKVISLNYRMAPEATHPAAVEDVELAYRELTKSYDPKHIGIYGCSAGGALTAQAASWLPTKGLPQPGAIGIFGAGAVRFEAGDSAHIAAYIDGSFPPPSKPGEPRRDMTRGYFDNADTTDPVISPALHPSVLEKFPPTLIITGTRAMDMSPAVVTNSRLLKAGVKSTLIVGEGMGHCYIYLPQLPEAHDAHDAIIGFFHDNLR